ncbi:MAG: hypothetical protein ABIL09_14310 [Gemmatimonadota bacterium]
MAAIFRADCYDSVLAELLDNQIAATTQARIRRFAMGWYEAGYRDGLAHRRHHTEFPGQI